MMNKEMKKRGYEDLRARIIEAAQEMFAARGYDRTTVEALIDSLGISKGGFYHHFASKLDLLDAVVERMMVRSYAQVGPVLRQGSVRAIDKLNLFLSASRTWRMENIGAVIGVARVIYRDENAIIRQKMNALGRGLMLADFVRVIEQGVAEGSFRTDEPELAAEFFLGVSNVVGEIQMRFFLERGDEPDVVARARERIAFFTRMLERILGASDGSIEPVDERFVRRLLSSASREGDRE